VRVSCTIRHGGNRWPQVPQRERDEEVAKRESRGAEDRERLGNQGIERERKSM
jgi:hypothetical protein